MAAYVLFAVGMVVVILEIFLPGVILGLIGVAIVVGAILLAFSASPAAGGLLVGIAVVTIPVILIIWVKVVGPALAHKVDLKNDEQARERLHCLVGQEGVAVTLLRPSGTGQFGERRVPVVTNGEVVDRDTRVLAVEVRGNQVVVRAVRV
jgi:membrane-bound serine protease (ClpP class)